MARPGEGGHRGQLLRGDAAAPGSAAGGHRPIFDPVASAGGEGGVLGGSQGGILGVGIPS